MLYNTAEEGINVSHAYLRKNPKSKLQFPSWKAVLGDLLAHARAHNPNDFDAGLPDCKGIADELTLLRDVILSRNLELLFSHVPSYRSTYTSSCNLDEVLAQFKSQPIRPNEFYAVFDLRTAQYREMDNKLNDLLGFRPADFDIPSLMQKDSFTHIFHPRDHYHMLRWACLAQAMVSARIFCWNSMEDQFRIRFRVRTQKSSIAAYRAHEFITLEKLCFLYNEESVAGCTPSMHIDKWLIYDRSEFEHVRPSWVSTLDRQGNLNAVLYLFNALLVNFPVQYLVYLHERCLADRNKAIASRLNENIFKSTGIGAQFEEQAVADCFAKTIRPRMEQTLNAWEFRKPGDLCTFESDAQAVQAARSLGLLPIPEKVLKFIYSGVIEM
jgi:hypothetical protein